ncbi:phosphoribosylanthranilate isomerase [Streptomyces sp. NBC_01190]|uniref:phosphoribosylanthranilate isomerase n=1 Tax=Streptomyces sp. NBC_01190 TaxID=2903767 RepID=UPI0038633CA7|nr:phosphoribosylanthranilate isomerase [Streptomyces sp. NBC_01190]
MFVKICGLRTPADVAAAVGAGADAVGFVLTDSPRQVTPAEVGRLVEAVPPGVLTVAVFGAEPLERVRREARAAGVRAVQLHGDHPPEAFAALRGTDPDDTGLVLVRATSAASAGAGPTGGHGEDLLILDAPKPGSGESWDWSALGTSAPGGHWMLAGGLAPHNVADAIAAARPWGVDVSSGVESRRGVKDHGLIADFVARAKAAGAE